jgi:hypothetical protein
MNEREDQWITELWRSALHLLSISTSKTAGDRVPDARRIHKDNRDVTPPQLVPLAIVLYRAARPLLTLGPTPLPRCQTRRHRRASHA